MTDLHGKIIMPALLTAENGAKGLLSGEFFESFDQHCPYCNGSGFIDEDEEVECDDCSGHGSYPSRVTISWTNIKSIYAKAAAELASSHEQDSGWISVKKPPEKYGKYLGSTKARPNGYVFTFAPVGWICSNDYPVTHWMPLPSAPTI